MPPVYLQYTASSLLGTNLPIRTVRVSAANITAAPDVPAIPEFTSPTVFLDLLVIMQQLSLPWLKSNSGSPLLPSTTAVATHQDEAPEVDKKPLLRTADRPSESKCDDEMYLLNDHKDDGEDDDEDDEMEEDIEEDDFDEEEEEYEDDEDEGDEEDVLPDDKLLDQLRTGRTRRSSIRSMEQLNELRETPAAVVKRDLPLISDGDKAGDKEVEGGTKGIHSSTEMIAADPSYLGPDSSRPAAADNEAALQLLLHVGVFRALSTSVQSETLVAEILPNSATPAVSDFGLQSPSPSNSRSPSPAQAWSVDAVRSPVAMGVDMLRKTPDLLKKEVLSELIQAAVQDTQCGGIAVVEGAVSCQRGL